MSKEPTDQTVQRLMEPELKAWITTIPFGIDEQFRMSEVKRWHVINTTREQSLADHSFQVAAMTRMILAAMGTYGHGWALWEAYNAIMMAMFHDAHEVWMGDKPTCAKKYETVPTAYTVQLYEDIASDLSPNKRFEAEKIIKLADTMEALVWISQNSTGSHARTVREELFQRWGKMIESEEYLFIPQQVRLDLHEYVKRVTQ